MVVRDSLVYYSSCVSASRLTLRKPLHTPRKSSGVVAQKTVA